MRAAVSEHYGKDDTIGILSLSVYLLQALRSAAPFEGGHGLNVCSIRHHPYVYL